MAAKALRVTRRVAVVALILTCAYFVRPAADFLWVAAGRVSDRVMDHVGPRLVKLHRDAVIDDAQRQGEEISQYLSARRLDASSAQSFASLDFSSPSAYTSTSGALRARLREELRYPPAGFDRAMPPVMTEVDLGEDELAHYRQLRIEVLPGVTAIGIYARPKFAAADARLPLVISAHGRGGKPDETSDGKLPLVRPNPRDLGWSALKAGYALWLPTFVHYDKESDGFREKLTVRAWEAGTSLPAIEIAKVVRALDLFASRPDIDPQRIAMMGQSYGGFYTLYTSAIDLRIKVAVVAAYFNDRELVLDQSEPNGYLDWRFPNSLRLWRDPVITALVAPRPLLVESGNQDFLFPIAGARKTAPEVARIYSQLGVADRFEFMEMVARHDFRGDEAMAFITKHLGAEAPSPESVAQAR